MKKAREILIWSVLAAYMIVTLGFVAVKRQQSTCSEIGVEIVDKTGNYFIEPSDVAGMIRRGNKEIIGCHIDTLNLNRIENSIAKHPSVKEARMFRTLSGRLRVDIEQRNPILRIINAYQQSFYIDEDGLPMPLSRQYTARVLVANGNIKENFQQSMYKLKNADYSHPDSLLGNMPAQLYFFTKSIQRNKFWRAQIDQIYVRDGEFELVPRIGAHVVMFGDIREYKTKLRNLKLVYEQGFGKEGWNKYKYINLKYKNQVICTKR